MSAIGPKRTFPYVAFDVAFGGKADIAYAGVMDRRTTPAWFVTSIWSGNRAVEFLTNCYISAACCGVALAVALKCARCFHSSLSANCRKPLSFAFDLHLSHRWGGRRSKWGIVSYFALINLH